VSAALPVAVIGAAGRIGSFACEYIDGAREVSLAARIEIADDLAGALADSGARVALDVTVAGLGLAHGLTILEAGLRPVIGTSGVDQSAVDELDRRARELGLGGIVVPNFCLGVWLLERLGRLAVAHFPEVEIIEEHHPGKRDSPSGTAAQLACSLERERGARAGAGPRGAVPIHSLRLPGLHSNHALRFGGSGETLTLRHETHDLAAFGPGLLAAIGYAAEASGVVLGLDAALPS